MIQRPRPMSGVFPGGMLLLLVLPALLPAQMATVRVEENLRSAPNGTLLGQVMPGTEMRAPTAEGQWVQVTMEGWVWTRSLQVRTGGDGELVVSAEEGENLRDAPSGRIAARLGRGTVLEELERVPGWIRVRRTGWIWAPSLTMSESSAPVRPASTAEDAATPPGTVSTGEAEGAAPTEPPPRAPVDGAPSGGADAGWLRTGERGAAVLTGPDGDTLGTTVEGAELRLLSREGSWGRIQMEGWVWLPHMNTEDGEPGGAAASAVTAAELSREPERFRSRLVELELQFVSLERAERVRTDFFEGEPFLLTRAAGEGGFVYVALPAERLDEVRGLLPLERITVVARVRTGSAGMTGSPILDLLELRRDPGRAPRR